MQKPKRKTLIGSYILEHVLPDMRQEKSDDIGAAFFAVGLLLMSPHMKRACLQVALDEEKNRG